MERKTKKTAMLIIGIVFLILGIVGITQKWATTGNLIYILVGFAFILMSFVKKKGGKK